MSLSYFYKRLSELKNLTIFGVGIEGDFCTNSTQKVQTYGNDLQSFDSAVSGRDLGKICCKNTMKNNSGGFLGL